MCVCFCIFFFCGGVVAEGGEVAPTSPQTVQITPSQSARCAGLICGRFMAQEAQ